MQARALKSKYRDADSYKARMQAMNFEWLLDKSLENRTLMMQSMMASMKYELNNN